MDSAVPFRMLKQREVAEMLAMTESWVEQMRLRGGGPAFHKIGRSVRYLVDDVLSWVGEQRRCSTSQVAYN
jgi:predicted DNA-binding transcriptional regulator AlpA